MPTAHLAFRNIGYAAFVGASWTWCIGMFLPVLLVRDFGLLGWVVFAVPNVIGAAALAWVVKDAQASRKLLHHHREAAVWFSIITIAFQVFFMGWLLHRLIGPQGPLLALGFVAVMVLLLRLRPTLDLWTAAAALIVSTLVFILLGGTGLLSLPHIDPSPAAWRGLAGLAPACLLGFLLCPYLDLTFHRARQQTSPAGGRFAFGLGFGLFFFAMIVLTLCYAKVLLQLLSGQPLTGMTWLVSWLLALHMAIQIGFTIAVHLREVLGGDIRQRHYPAGVAVAVLVAAGLALLSRHGSTWHGLDRGEFIYRGFMGFYGLIFPAYFWICMVPGRTTGHRSRTIFVLAVAIALPFFALGFLGQQMLWLIPGVAIVLLARLVLSRNPRPTPQASLQ